MIEQVFKLIFPPAQMNNPILNNLIRSFDKLEINILRGDISSSSGWLEVQLVGTSGHIESATSWLEDRGIAVQALGF